MSRSTLSRRSLLALASLLAMGARSNEARAAAAGAARLRLGISAPGTTLDPHAQNNGPNNALAMHIYDAVVANDAQSRSQPGLAVSWRLLDDTHWEFTLRDGVVFSDGAPFGIADVIASFDRVRTLASPSSFRNYIRTVKAITPGAGERLMVIETHAPDPLLLNSISRIHIISARYKDAGPADFDSGHAAIGTGPFTLAEYVPGGFTRLLRNARHWGPQPAWDEAVLRVVSDSAARTAGLLAGDLDIIENVPPEVLPRIGADPKLHVITGVSSRMTFMAFDFGRAVTPFATDAAGTPLPRNPFLDLRVRTAFDHAINRKAIVERVMENQATVAAQYLPTGAPGTSPDLVPTPYDPDRAKALLAEAGYPNGFRLTIHGPNNRYINDGRILQAVGQMLTRIGVQTAVEPLPWNVYAPKCNNSEYSFFMGSFGINTGETSNGLVAGAATYDPKGGMGPNNFGRYSNPALDAKLREALPILDDARRNRLLAEASQIVFTDRAILPLHFEGLVLAARNGITYRTRADQYTLAADVVPG